MISYERREPEQSESDDFKNWSEWLHSAQVAITELCLGQYVYKEMLEISRRNTDIQKPSLFYSWMRTLFVTWSVALVGRLVDDKHGTRSFVRLLRDLGKKSHRLSREHHINLYMINFPDGEAKRIATCEYDSLVGRTDGILPQKQVDEDVKSLIEMAKPIITFRHQRIAHFDSDPMEQLPTYADLDAVIETLVKLLRKYSLLIRGVPADPFPTVLDDWSAIFRVPWIKEG
jgi:hypothetical protein